MAKRFFRIARPTAILVAIGLLYILLHRLTGFAVPCPVRAVLGLYCPGCGVSRMFFHLSRLELYEAFSSNCALFVLLPVFLFALMDHGYRYVRYGDPSFKRWENTAACILGGVLMVFAVVRNICPAAFPMP